MAVAVLQPAVIGNINGMKTTIDRAGRIVVPKSLRMALGLSGGDEVEITLEGERIELVPVPRKVSLRKGPGGLLVSAVGVGVGPDEVREELERTRP